jgi:hypothetical protein
MDAKNLPKVVLRTKGKVTRSPDELLKWIKDFSPELHMDHCMVLHIQSELKPQRLSFFLQTKSAIKLSRRQSIRFLQDSLRKMIRS